MAGSDPKDREGQDWAAGVRKAMLFSGGTGVLFGVASSLFMAFSGSPEAPKGPVLLIVPMLTGLISGAAGTGGAYLDRLLMLRGVTRPGVRRMIAFLTIALVTFGLAGLAASKVDVILRGNAVLAILLGLGFGVVVALIDYRLWQMRQRLLTLEIENKYLSEIARKDTLLAEATENLLLAEERNRVARDLHDSVSSGIHGIVYAVHSLKQALSAPQEQADHSGGAIAPARIGGILDLLEKTAQSTQDELRAMILELKPSLLDEKGLAEALRLHCELFAQRQGVPVDLSVEDAPDLSPEQQVAIYRIAQEALTNVQKHSGATRASVSLARYDDAVALTIADNGRGLSAGAASGGGLGMKNMESRCRRNGGTFKVTSVPGAGTTIEASFQPVE